MKYFTILDDYIAHTVLYMIKAVTKDRAIEIYVEKICGGEKLGNGKWLMIDYSNKKNNKTYDTAMELIQKEYMRIKNYRFEILEIDFDPESDCQEIFCSKEKEIR